MPAARRQRRPSSAFPERDGFADDFADDVVRRSEKRESADYRSPAAISRKRRITKIEQLNAAEQKAASEAIRQEARDELAIESLAFFMRSAWSIVEPGRKLVWGWHYDIICDELEQITRGEKKRLVICVPPGTGKTITVQQMWTAWHWLHHPEKRILALSANQRALIRTSVVTRQLIESPWYKGLVKRIAERQGPEGAGAWTLKKDDNQKTSFSNTAGGWRAAVSYGGRLTAERPDGIIVDDPLDAGAIIGEPEAVRRRLEHVVALFDGSIRQRIDPKTGWRVVVMQRLHEGDLAGELKRRGWPHVVLPMEHDEDDKQWKHPRDPRHKTGQLLFPGRFSRKWCKAQRSAGKDGEKTYLAQYQQNPSPAQGRLFKRHFFLHRYTERPERLAKTLDELAITVDAAFKGNSSSDRVAIQVWGRKGPDRYLLDSVCDRMDFPETLQALCDVREKWPAAKLILIEDKANGPALVATLKRHIDGVIPYDPKIDKYARAQGTALTWESGHVWLPADSLNLPWVSGYIEEHVLFPAVHDDQVDATSQILLRWDEHKPLTAAEALRPMRALNEELRKAGPITGRSGGPPRRR